MFGVFYAYPRIPKQRKVRPKVLVHINQKCDYARDINGYYFTLLVARVCCSGNSRQKAETKATRTTLCPVQPHLSELRYQH
jgi:hypothetical protein